MSAQIAYAQPALRPSRVARPAFAVYARPAATSCVLLAADMLAVFLARAVTVSVWHWVRPAVGLPNFLGFWESLVLFALAYAALGLYSGGAVGVVEELRRVALGTGLVCLTLTASLFFLQRAGPYSRGLLVLSGVLTAAAVPLARSSARHLFASRRWWGVPVLVLGAGGAAQIVIGRLRANPQIGFKPVACFADEIIGSHCAGVPVAGPLSAAGGLAKRLKIRHALVAMPGVAREDLVWMLDEWGAAFSHVILIPNLFGLASLWVSARDVGGILGLEMRQNLLIPLNRWTKRAIDIAGALALGCMALPIAAAAALWIKCISRGSVLYRQEREGEGGGALRIPKLRTMHADAEALLMRVLSESPEIRAEWTCRFKLKNDPRILPGVGKFLRKTSLDELPQLWRVLKGEMSLVGPRPFPRYHLDRFGPRFRALRHRVKPGLTGLWQVSDRSDGDLAVQETLDTYYIRNWSLWLDLYILARTIRAVLFPKGAY